MKPIKLPWRTPHMPHAALDLLRGCNIRCRHCYNTSAPACKPFDQLTLEVGQLKSLRKLDMLSLTGGEPLLHPDLERLVELVRKSGIHPVVITNALLLDEAKTAALAKAGCAMIVVHIQESQQRPDLPDPTPETAARLREEKAAMIHRHGMRAGFSMTIPPDDPTEARRAFDAFTHSPHAQYMLCTVASDVSQFKGWRVTIDQAVAPPGKQPPPAPAVNRESILNALTQSRLALFSWLGGQLAPDTPRWMAWTALRHETAKGTVTIHPLTASWLERAATRIFRRLKGRYPVLLKQSAAKTRIHVLLNAFLGGRLANAGVVLRSFGKNTLIEKHILFEFSPEFIAPGALEYCGDCVDATVRNGVLVPLCLADAADGEF